MAGCGYAAEMAGAIMTMSKTGEECLLGDTAFFGDGCIYSHEAPGFCTGAALGEDHRQGEFLTQFLGGGAIGCWSSLHFASFDAGSFSSPSPAA